MALLNGVHRRFRSFWPAAVAAAAIFLCTLASPAAAQREASLDEVKAAFVFQFSNYITWPEDAFEDESTAITIGIVGNEPVAKLLRESVRDKIVANRPVAVIEVASPEQAAACHIVFLDRRDDKRVDEFLAMLSKKPVLTVSDDDNFTEEGGIIKLYEQQKKLRIEINVDESERSNLVISSKLLNLAKVVRDQT
jgi:hypothetical protein